VHIYIYIYIERERERESDWNGVRQVSPHTTPCLVMQGCDYTGQSMYHMLALLPYMLARTTSPSLRSQAAHSPTRLAAILARPICVCVPLRVFSHRLNDPVNLFIAAYRRQSVKGDKSRPAMSSSHCTTKTHWDPYHIREETARWQNIKQAVAMVTISNHLWYHTVNDVI